MSPAHGSQPSWLPLPRIRKSSSSEEGSFLSKHSPTKHLMTLQRDAPANGSPLFLLHTHTHTHKHNFSLSFLHAHTLLPSLSPLSLSLVLSRSLSPTLPLTLAFSVLPLKTSESFLRRCQGEFSLEEQERSGSGSSWHRCVAAKLEISNKISTFLKLQKLSAIRNETGRSSHRSRAWNYPIVSMRS